MPLNLRYMQLGVSVPIRNRKYRFGTSWTNTLSVAGPQGAPGSKYFTSQAASFTPVWPRQCFENTISKILVGPSTNPANLSAREILTVSSVVHPNQINVIENPQFLYAIGDPISGLGDRMPGGWQLYSDAGTPTHVEIEPQGIRDKSFGASQVLRGVYDAFHFRLDINDSDNQHVEQRFDAGAFLGNTQYLLGFFYKIVFPPSAGPEFHVQLSMSGTTNIINEVVRLQVGGDVTNWTYWRSTTSEDVGSFATGVNGVSVENPTTPLVLRLPKPVGGIPNDFTLWLDSPFICHAQGTDGYLAGIYTFEELPAYQSGNWAFRTFVREAELANGDLISYDPTGGGGRIRKWTFTCRFVNISDAFLSQLLILQEWQDEGNDLVLVTNEERHGVSFPVAMVGRMELSGIGREHWDLTQRSFTFTFNET